MIQKELIKYFIEGGTEGFSNGAGNLKIYNNILVHFNTVIAERQNKKIIINMTRYSVVTGRIQKILLSLTDDENRIIVTKIPKGTSELKCYIEKKELE